MMSEMRASLVGADLAREMVSRMSRLAPMLTSRTVVSGGHHAENAGGGISAGQMLALAPCVPGWQMKT